ncbi:MAG: MarR family winged helix-turn-helix transcriptional regulator [Chloroflexota bacterium]
MAAESVETQCERTAALLHRVSRALRDPQDEDWLSLDVSMAQLKVLFSLYYRGPATVGVLAGKMGVTLPTVSATLDRLVRAGYVVREDDPDDRRMVINRLTAVGTALVERLREERRARVDQALARLTAPQVTILQEGLQALAGALGLVRPTPPPEPTGGPPA